MEHKKCGISEYGLCNQVLVGIMFNTLNLSIVFLQKETNIQNLFVIVSAKLSCFSLQ